MGKAQLRDLETLRKLIEVADCYTDTTEARAALSNLTDSLVAAKNCLSFTPVLGGFGNKP